MANRRNIVAWTAIGALLSLAIPIAGTAIPAVCFPQFRLMQLPLHALVESAGGMVALAIAGILLAELGRRECTSHYPLMAAGFAGMGVLDLFHAASTPGNHFVWLHSTATFVGGVLFGMLWSSGSVLRLFGGFRLPLVVAILSVVFGGASILAADFLPVMRTPDGTFSMIALVLNVSGGTGFLIASTFFVRRFVASGDFEDWLFGVQTMLFGAAGVLFAYSVIWDGAWWWWHVLRLAAYVAALWYGLRTFRNAERDLRRINHQMIQTNTALDRTVEERTAKLRATEERFELAVRGSTDGLWDWNVLTNEVFYSPRMKELVGYADDEFPDVFASFETRLHPADHDWVLQAVNAHLRDRKPYDVEYRLLTKSGEIFLNVDAESIMPERVRLHFSVRDTGIGIQADKLDCIFHPFEQAESSTTRRFGGTGLGLAISRQLVEMMHGKMWVESKPDVGSVFHFTAEFGVAANQHQHEPAELSSLQDLPVLVVDDNFTNRRILGEMLQYWKMHPLLVDSAAAARQVLREAEESHHPIRLILLDHHMPAEDGLHFAESVQSIVKRHHCPIIVISSGSAVFDAELCEKYGISRFMTKPVIASELLNEVLRQFGRFVNVKPEQLPTAKVLPKATPRRVLLVEDNAINRRVALGLLSSRGHQAVVAVNGQEAVDSLAVQEFDVVLMDMQMPTMDGYAATAEIRRRERQTGGHIPIVAMTAEALKGDRERCLEAGMDDYVSKPITPAEMYRAIEQFPALCRPFDFDLRNPAEHKGPSPRSQSERSPIDAVNPFGSLASQGNSGAATVPAVDWTLAMKMLGNERAALAEYSELLKREAPLRVAEIRRAIELRDAKLLQRAAHTLKGSSSYFGAEFLTQTAQALEQLGHDESFAGAAELLETLEREFARVVVALDIGPPELPL